MVSVSPWPILSSFSILAVSLNFLSFLLKESSLIYFLVSLSSLVLISMMWWRDVVRESTFLGCHTKKVCSGLYFGVIMFILSEVMFFFSFFFSFFFLSLNPDVEIGLSWPPAGIQPLSFMEVPLLNTVLLLSSGVSITWVHHSILEKNKSAAIFSGFLTVLLGVIFIFFQYLEYFESSFSMSDSSYGSLFFLMTGFHGIHVIVGTIFILIQIIRLGMNHFSNDHHLGFEASAWYWHFVDVVWLFLYISIYWWGS